MDAHDTAAPHLSRPLPVEIAQGEFGAGWYYARFAAFSWRWSARRTVLFGAVALPFGAMLGVIHGLYAHDAAQGAAVGWRAALAALLAVGTGPVLAAMVRQLRLGQRAERLGVVGAVVAGVLLSWSARVYVETFHGQLMGVQVTAAQHWLQLFSGEWPMHAIVENLTDLIAALTVHAVGNGALALRSYFDEPRRWQAYAARREIDALRQQKLAAEARLSVLQAQVEPHFLFNTLASVSAEIEDDPIRARDLVEALAQYLRATLPRLRQVGAAPSSTLFEQFELCRRYLTIMALRLGPRFKLTVELPEELGQLSFPPLLLFCLVENAVTHGVEPKAGPATIGLAARLIEVAGDQALEVSVTDDGMGLREGLVEGTGISNVRSQLATLFGAAARFSIESPAARGTCATITLPLQVLVA